MIHAVTCCSTGHAEAGPGPGPGPRAGADLLFFLLEDVTQGTMACTNGVLQSGAQEAIGSPGAVTWDEL